MKNAYYFSHDSNARYDPKITAMRGVYGAEGYGWYWILVEMMRDANAYKLDMQGKYTWNAYAQQMGCKCSDDAKDFIVDCIEEFQLFQSDESFFWSNSLIGRMEKREEVVEKRRKAAQTRWGKLNDLPEPGEDMHLHSGEDTHASDDHSHGYANGMQGKESKVKERKVNKSTNKKVITRQKKIYAEDSTPYKMASYLHQKILEHAAESGVSHLVEKSNMQTWADDCRKLLEIDKIDKALIKDVIDWATVDLFWQTNILSASKLREKFQELALKMTQEKKRGDKNVEGIREHGGNSSGSTPRGNNSSGQANRRGVAQQQFAELGIGQ